MKYNDLINLVLEQMISIEHTDEERLVYAYSSNGHPQDGVSKWSDPQDLYFWDNWTDWYPPELLGDSNIDKTFATLEELEQFVEENILYKNSTDVRASLIKHEITNAFKKLRQANSEIIPTMVRVYRFFMNTEHWDYWFGIELKWTSALKKATDSDIVDF